MERFFESYASGEPEDLPWYNPEPDADLVRWFDELLEGPSRVIDLGAGPSVHGIFLAGRGHDVTAVDGVPAARDLALRLARERGVEIDYHVADVLAWEPPERAAWDLVLDRGFLHTLEPEDRPRWLDRVRGLLRPGGALVLKAFTAEPRGFGPPGLTAAETLGAIREGEPDGLRLVDLARSSFNLADRPDVTGAHSAWTLVARGL
ncbi:MAG: class I SAM-dependent methyltransferase [Thermoanaerobaculia bacterium]